MLNSARPHGVSGRLPPLDRRRAGALGPRRGLAGGPRAGGEHLPRRARPGARLHARGEGGEVAEDAEGGGVGHLTGDRPLGEGEGR